MKKTLFLIVILALLSMACLFSSYSPPPTPPPNLALTVTAQAQIIQNNNNLATQTSAAPAVSATPIVAPAAAATATSQPDATATVALTPTQSIPMVTPLKDAVNCRFGPSVDYEQVFALNIGALAPITGKSTDGGWWQIKTTDTANPNCWVSIPFVTSSGDLSAIPTVQTPAALIDDVQVFIKPDSVNLGSGCVGPFPKFKITGTITVNGPMKVTWYIETQQDGKTSGHSLSFSKYGSQFITFDYTPSSWKKGNYWVHLVITSPISITRSASYQVICQ